MTAPGRPALPKKVKAGLITTLQTNLGDDCIREGICDVLREVHGEANIDFVLVNKHEPLTVYPAWHPARIPKFKKRLPRGGYWLDRQIESVTRRMAGSRFDDCNLIVQCGAPVLWPDCHANEWTEVLWDTVVARMSRAGVPVYNLGAGACYAWERPPSRVENQADADYLKRIGGYCTVTTVRDELAHRLLADLGVESTFLPCPAFLCGRRYRDQGSPSEGLVLVNYMKGGGHFDWDQQIDGTRWQKTVEEIVAALRQDRPVAFLCHNAGEYDEAGRIWPDLPRFLPKTPAEFFQVVSRAEFALCNRLHASVAMAGYGVPSIAVGADTRMLMVQELGLATVYVKEAATDSLLPALQKLAANGEAERQRLRALQDDAWSRYVALLRRQAEAAPGHLVG